MFHMAVSAKVPVGSNRNTAWNYGGEQIGVTGPTECPMGSWGPWLHRPGWPQHFFRITCFTKDPDLIGHWHIIFVDGPVGRPSRLDRLCCAYFFIAYLAVYMSLFFHTQDYVCGAARSARFCRIETDSPCFKLSR